jgi:Zn-dependent M32 family carboxypeptidase
MSALEKLRDRMAELSDLSAMQMLAAWDQLVTMPAEGAAARAQQLGTLARLTHERATGEEVGEWLAERVHRHGRRLDTLPLLAQATGEDGLAVEPFLRYVSPLAGR